MPQRKAAKVEVKSMENPIFISKFAFKNFNLKERRIEVKECLFYKKLVIFWSEIWNSFSVYLRNLILVE